MNQKILVSFMIIGVTAAAAGGSTFALFNDSESSESNVFTAGAIDLKIDWNESYNGVSQENQSLTDLRYPENSSIFELDDVKPGDEGEATISMHVYDNPGYIWMRMQPQEHLDVTCTEPEGVAEMEGPEVEGEPTPGCDEEGEIRENLNFTLWYDDGDNVKQEDEPLIRTGNGDQICRPGDQVDVAIVIDRSGSMGGTNIEEAKAGARTLVDSLNDTDQSAYISFAGGASLDQNLTTNKTAVKEAINATVASGSTNMASGVEIAREELINGTNARPGAQKVMVVLGDGDVNTDGSAAKADGIRIISIALAGADQEMEDLASSPDDYYESPTASDLQQVFEDISGTICRSASNLEEGILLDADPGTDEVDAFVNSTTRYIGFKWEMPLEVGNKVQTDSFVANLDFYAEQERNNPAPENPWN